jgi:hypothetical protein
VAQADSDEFLDGSAIKLLVEVVLIAEAQREQVNQESHKLLFANKVAFVALAEDLVDDVLDDGALWREQEFVADLRRPHFDGLKGCEAKINKKSVLTLADGY